MKLFKNRSIEGYQTKKSIINRRKAILTTAKYTFFGLIGLRLLWLQVFQKNKYSILSDRNRFKEWKIAAERGLILDRFNNKIAENRQLYRIALIKGDVTDLGFVLVTLDKFLRLDSEIIEKTKIDFTKLRKFQPYVINKNLTWAEFSKINSNLFILNGVQPFISMERHYNYPYEFAHVLGYVGVPNENDLQNQKDDLFRTPGIKIGKLGIEKILNRELIGTPGFTRFEVNAAGRAVRTVEFVDGISGNALKTSLDLELQKLTYQKFGRYAGSAIAMDIKTGEVLACVSTPSFDTNKFAFGITQPEFNELLKNERKPLINKFLSGQYSPGSVVKPIIGLAALENKIVDQDYTHFCSGKIELYGQEFYCWKDGGHGKINLKDAIKKSCDIYFYEVARLLGVDRLAETIRKFNFGQTTLKDFDEEKKGLVPDTKWKKNVLGKPWLLGETLITGIGQGYILATPMQICKSMAELANGGYIVNPTFYLDEKSKSSRMDFDAENIKIINEALVAATNEPGGTSYNSRLNGKLKFAGKTGTSQVTKLTIKDREDNANPNSREYKYRDHSLFAGFGPVEEPKYAVAVVAEHAGPGSRVAAPIASSMFDFLFKKRISNA
ncbi:FtsI Cell division protein FtsI/penicillin-binding protein 2 [Candidatus Pelagibacterales bacterium]